MMRGRNKFFAGLGVAIACVLSLAGCGGGGPHEASDEQRTAIEATFDEYLAAVKDKDAEATCALLSPESLEQIGGEEACIDIYEPLLKEQGEILATTLGDLQVDKIEVADDDSIARMYFTDAPAPLRFQPSGDLWLVVPPDAITGTGAAAE